MGRLSEDQEKFSSRILFLKGNLGQVQKSNAFAPWKCVKSLRLNDEGAKVVVDIVLLRGR
jgi:hypothetical protein